MTAPALPLSRACVPVLEWLDEAGSTNDELVARSADLERWPDLSVVVTDDQTGGRGRLGRTWTAPAGKTLAISVLLRPRTAAGRRLGPDALSWLPLLAGLAMTGAVRDLGVDATLKWPNDVLAAESSPRPGKLCGVLSELLPDATGVVIGAGLNLTMTADELPVDTASSLSLAGVEAPEPDATLAGYLRELTGLYRALLEAGGDPVSSGLRDAVMSACGTLGRVVRVELPSGEMLNGTATDIDGTGRLVVQSAGATTAVAAGDVTHLRH
jgi:BirA family biotin operon repressor/biotin-[acetyl-CoA-carboxylase] ligase